MGRLRIVRLDLRWRWRLFWGAHRRLIVCGRTGNAIARIGRIPTLSQLDFNCSCGSDLHARRIAAALEMQRVPGEDDFVFVVSYR